ncbi:aminotransferase class I/II-fold pyridoxal phosphate-dependent enzyme [Candidatus Woesearchaeota archaeon]|nr:aminotransferase class I/II-fold pyridoxal phosphate-dependent enzyme [Candidatus Woesearchaeota archaeon]
MGKEEILAELQKLTGHNHLEITLRGDAAITAAIFLVPKDKILLIPEEGGWLSYPKIPKKLGLKVVEVKCDDARINLKDLQQKLQEHPCGALLYQNPGGYFAEQPMEEIYQLCQKNQCLVIMDVSGSIGTKLCNGKYADILVGSFGEWKLVEAKVGGFISCKNQDLFEKVKKHVAILEDKKILKIISQKIEELPQRISFLTRKRDKIMEDLKRSEVVHKQDVGFVVIVRYNDQTEKENLIKYCNDNDLPWTECPRYIRLNKPAISIEVKRL